MLRWKCRKGIRELDILLTNYLDSTFVKLPKQDQEIFARFVDIDPHEMFDIVFNKKPFNEEFSKIVQGLSVVNQIVKNEKKN